MKAIIISADGFEDTELLVPYYRLIEEGIEVDIVSLHKGKITGKRGYDVGVDKVFQAIDPKDYDILIIPGGKAPAVIRSDSDVMRIVKHFFDQNKTVAAICHGPQVLVSAGVITGRHATSYHSVAPEIKEAGVIYEDTAVVVDSNLVTSRNPADLPFFMREIMKKIVRK